MRKPLRLKHLITFAALAICSLAGAQNVGISAPSGAPLTPDANAILDIDVTGLSATGKRGMLIPRMTMAQRLAIGAGTGDNGLLVYQTDTGTVYDVANQRGFWYYSSVAPIGWVHLSVVRSGWFLNGNTVGSVTGSFPEHLGTANLSPNRNLVFRTVLAPANPAMQMGWELFDYKSGFVGLGTAAPAVERLEVQGAIRLEKNATIASHVSTPTEGSIRYGTFNGAASDANNLNWHWGTDADSTGTIRWSRLENAENLITPPKSFPKDTVACVGVTGDAMRGFLSPTPVTMPVASPANFYSPFATNFTPTTFEGAYRVQYLYRYSELVEAGLCFPATINAFSFYCLDQENLGNPAGVPPVPATQITGEIRMGPATTVLDNSSAAFGSIPSAPFMDDIVRGSAIRGSFVTFSPGPGWITFTLSNPLILPTGKNLVIDIVWSRSKGVGVGPKVELEDPGFNCTKWVLKANIGTGTQSVISRGIMDDNPINPSGAVVTGGVNAHSKRPVTRFTGTVVTPTVEERFANYIQYDGGLMIGSAAWLAGAPFHGAGTVNAQKGVYDGGTLLSDHVFDRYFDGAARPEEAHSSQGYAYVGLDQLRQRLESDRHLPNMPSRTEWETKGGASLGTITTGLWESVEDQALYITQLEKDLAALEEMAFGTDLSPQEAQRLIAEVQGSKRLSEAQKLHLIDALNEKALPNTKP